MVQLSYPYLTTGKIIALTRWPFVDKVISLLFNMLSKFIIAYLSRSKHLLISWMQPPCAVILEPKKIKMIKNFQTLSKNMDKNSRFNKGPEAKRSHLSTGWAEQWEEAMFRLPGKKTQRLRAKAPWFLSKRANNRESSFLKLYQFCLSTTQ